MENENLCPKTNEPCTYCGYCYSAYCVFNIGDNECGLSEHGTCNLCYRIEDDY